MKGVCVEVSNTANLVVGEIYYLFPHGGSAYYVSRFPTKESHLGAYQKRYFEIVEEVADDSHEIVQKSNKKVHEHNKMVLENNELEHKIFELALGKIYRAKLNKNPKEYNKELGIYYVTCTASQYYHPSDCYFYEDPELNQLCGRFPIEWFTDFVEVTEQTQLIIEAVELPQDEWKQLQLF